MMPRSTSTYFYVLAILLFFVDVSAATFFDQYRLATLVCLFCGLLFTTRRLPGMAFVLFLLSCESLLFHGRFGLALIYLIPLLLVAQRIRKLLLLPRALPYLTLLACIAAETLLIEYLILGWPVVVSYTGIKIFGSMIVQCLVLKYAF